VQPRFIISGGGTGGHIFPAIAIADELRLRFPDAVFMFVGAKGRMEMEKVPEAGYPIQGLWISGLQRSLSLKNLSFPFKVVSSILKARQIIREFKPDAVIGTGGYASGPMLRAAAGKGIPTLILEQNSYAGVTNKLLGRQVDRICVAFPGMERFFPADKIVVTGNPVRQKIVENGRMKSKEGFAFFGWNPEKFTLLDAGGSLGSRTINESIYPNIGLLADAGIQLIWQCGNAWYDKAKEKVDAMKNPAIMVFPFIREMEMAYSVADLVVSRAGAIAISELCLLGKPAILVPSPNVAEDHQTKNALALTSRNAARLIKDLDAPAMLVKDSIHLIKDKESLAEMALQIQKLASADAVQRIADCVIEIMRKR